MKTIIKNGTIVTTGDIYITDIEIENEKIISLKRDIVPLPQDHVLDVNGCYVFPGGIDVHTHLEWPFQSSGTADGFESGTKAAAVGGITSIINFTDPKKDMSLLDNLKEWKQKGKKSVIDYGFHSIICGYHDQISDELVTLANEEGVTSIKLFMAYKEQRVNDTEMYKIMKKAGEIGILTNIHAENGEVIDCLVEEAILKGNTSPIYHAYTRPQILEAEATGRALAIAEMADAPIYIVHVSCKEALEELYKAKKRNPKVFGETCPHYLILDESLLDQPNFEGGKYVCSPPLRKKWNQEVLWEGIKVGAISTIGSDHCPFHFSDQKTIGQNDFSKIPNGVPGIEDMYSLIYHYGVYENRISMNKFVEVTSTNPAKLFGMYPQKGTIAIGSDADLVIVDPKQSRMITKDNQYQYVDYNLYEGHQVQGVIKFVLSRGEVIAESGKFVGKLKRGRYLYRNKYQNL